MSAVVHAGRYSARRAESLVFKKARGIAKTSAERKFEVWLCQAIATACPLPLDARFGALSERCNVVKFGERDNEGRNVLEERRRQEARGYEES
ncbi:hypothetical protein SNOG_03137 [Parastagonospora nodorum SN15]|uniref:Uncharacterized protein n=1 Tax=Phaeosphaeria nodorum (strain SN15 / ATCC MYA-4574 / FGSC 10173) TaxID=321614 RepID=Q0UYM7_PHANO|nr:hypothetical protein SNOG_03137 [Parastagonospora nodorum SN15]EAT89868.1 hypothetical protein SNOG_03137 [Parastagonospora nodorum SN15]